MTVNTFLRSTGIQCLYHFSDKMNLPLIRKYGLLSRAELMRQGIVPPKPGGNKWSNDADLKKGLDGYIHLCFKNQHPMERMARENGRIATTRFLRISLKVLYDNGVMGCCGVSNKTGVTILPLEQALNEMDFKKLFSTKNYRSVMKYEILVPNLIPTELIYNIK